MDEELRTLLTKLADSIDSFSARLDAVENKGNQLFDEYDKAQKKFDHDEKRKDWDAKYSEKLGPYVDKAKAIKGDDFDLMEESMNEYYSENGVDSDAYVQCLIDTMEEKFKSIADRLTGNAEADKAEVEKAADEAVTEVADKTETEPQAEPEQAEPQAEVTVTAEAEPEKDKVEPEKETITSDEKTKEAVTDATTEAKSETETEKKDDVDKAEDKVDDKKDELDEFTKELEAEKNKLDQKHVGN